MIRYKRKLYYHVSLGCIPGIILLQPLRFRTVDNRPSGRNQNSDVDHRGAMSDIPSIKLSARVRPGRNQGSNMDLRGSMSDIPSIKLSARVRPTRASSSARYFENQSVIV